MQDDTNNNVVGDYAYKVGRVETIWGRFGSQISTCMLGRSRIKLLADCLAIQCKSAAAACLNFAKQCESLGIFWLKKQENVEMMQKTAAFTVLCMIVDRGPDNLGALNRYVNRNCVPNVFTQVIFCYFHCVNLIIAYPDDYAKILINLGKETRNHDKRKLTPGKREVPKMPEPIRGRWTSMRYASKHFLEFPAFVKKVIDESQPPDEQINSDKKRLKKALKVRRAKDTVHSHYFFVMTCILFVARTPMHDVEDFLMHHATGYDYGATAQHSAKTFFLLYAPTVMPQFFELLLFLFAEEQASNSPWTQLLDYSILNGFHMGHVKRLAFENVMQIAARYWRRVIFELYNTSLVAFRMLLPYECQSAAGKLLELCKDADPNEYIAGLYQHHQSDIEKAACEGILSDRLRHNLDTTLRRMPLSTQEGETTNKALGDHGDRCATTAPWTASDRTVMGKIEDDQRMSRAEYHKVHADAVFTVQHGGWARYQGVTPDEVNAANLEISDPPEGEFFEECVLRGHPIKWPLSKETSGRGKIMKDLFDELRKACMKWEQKYLKGEEEHMPMFRLIVAPDNTKAEEKRKQRNSTTGVWESMKPKKRNWHKLNAYYCADFKKTTENNHGWVCFKMTRDLSDESDDAFKLPAVDSDNAYAEARSFVDQFGFMNHCIYETFHSMKVTDSWGFEMLRLVHEWDTNYSTGCLDKIVTTPVERMYSHGENDCKHWKTCPYATYPTKGKRAYVRPPNRVSAAYFAKDEDIDDLSDAD